MKAGCFLRGYFTKVGVIFVSAYRLLRFDEIIAEPGDLINVEGNTVINLSRTAIHNPRRAFPLCSCIITVPLVN